ncbi:MAG TPA: VOC family protein [Alphaproteobacteria bacterium]|nr:VOC family protein [Alphaproteobacteria bacterium]HOO50039.1 VOC family protein [Alphaproteobacteria bacterium]
MSLDTAMTPELGVTDYKKSLEFYVGVLGFTVQYDRPEEGFAMLERQGSRIMIDEFREGKRAWVSGPLEYPLGRGLNLQMDTADARGLYERAKASGAKIFLELEEKWYRIDPNTEAGNLQFNVLDPDGYMLRFAEDLGDRPIEK